MKIKKEKAFRFTFYNYFSAKDQKTMFLPSEQHSELGIATSAILSRNVIDQPLQQRVDFHPLNTQTESAVYNSSFHNWIIQTFG